MLTPIHFLWLTNLHVIIVSNLVVVVLSVHLGLLEGDVEIGWVGWGDVVVCNVI